MYRERDRERETWSVALEAAERARSEVGGTEGESGATNGAKQEISRLMEGHGAPPPPLGRESAVRERRIQIQYNCDKLTTFSLY